MKCPRCQQENASRAKFCMACGAGISATAKDQKGGVRSKAGPRPSSAHKKPAANLKKHLSAALKREAETREQQAATSEILRVIGSSPSDLQPVFDIIAKRAAALTGAAYGAVYLVEGETIHLRARYSDDIPNTDQFAAAFPMPITSDTLIARTLRTGTLAHIADMEAVNVPEAGRSLARTLGVRSTLTVPMRRGERAIGAIGVNRRRPGDFSAAEVALLQTFADQAVIAIENVRLFTELQEKNRALAQAHAQVTASLEQQTATAEILGVISSSPNDVQPVFDAIVQSAARLCKAQDASIFRREGDTLVFVAHHGPIAERHGDFSLPLVLGTVGGRSVLESRTVQVADLQNDDGDFPDAVEYARRFGFRTILSVPLLRDGIAVGGIQLRRAEVQPFSERQIELLQTFADQAVIAIENVRLFTELEEKNRALTTAHAHVSDALEQQTATAEVLKVISRATFELEPVLDTLIQNAAKLCGARRAVILRRDGDAYHGVAFYNASAELIDFIKRHPVTAGRHSITARVALERRTIHVADLQSDPEYSYALRDIDPIRTELGVPMFRGDDVIGVMILYKLEVQPFTDKQVELVETFAHQAVIAIENVRLFTELQQKNDALTQAHAQVTESLEQQTATSEVLRVISSSRDDVRPVFQTIVENAMQLCSSSQCAVFRLVEGQVHLVAYQGRRASNEIALRAYPQPLDPGSVQGMALIEKRVVHIPDLEADDRFPFSRAVARAGNYRSLLIIPLLKDGVATGSIGIGKADPFTAAQITLLQTFADQAVIAIENVRLFSELQASNRELTEALGRETATGAILSVISRSPTDIRPVLSAVAESAARLCHAYDVTVFRLEDDVLRLVAHHGPVPATPQLTLSVTRDTVGGRTVIEARTIQVADAQLDDGEFPLAVSFARQFGHRTLLSVPLMRERAPIGVIQLRRTEVARFSDAQIALLQTFADQAVIAIENVRLFTELQEKNRALTQAHGQVTETLEQQTATGEILRVISSSPTDVQPVFETIARSATTLCEADLSGLYRFDGDRIHFAAEHGRTPAETAAAQKAFPQPPSHLSVTARAIVTADIVQVGDVSEEPEVADALRMFRTVLSVPMLRDGRPLGAITVARRVVRPFTDKQITLLRTFADQAVIAIENVRLFTELQEKNRALTEAHARVSESLEQQTATAEILRIISASPTDLAPVFDSILANACRLCDANFAALWRVSGDELVGTASYNASIQFAEHMKRNPLVPSRQGPTRLAALEQRTVHIADMTIEPGFSPVSLHFEKARTVLSVPLMRDAALVGVLSMWRREVRVFTEQQIALVQTFADQAVIAIENVRLFTELEARTEELTRSVGELRALSEVGQAISSTLDLPSVLSTIVARAAQLSGTDAGVIYEYDEVREIFVPRATENLEAAIVETMLSTPVRKGEGATGQLAQVQEPIQVPDILAAPAESRVRGSLVRAGYRALLAVPLVREDHLIGGLTVIRKATGEFGQNIIELLKTFATQSTLAIQNARLFREIDQKSRELEAASRHKSEFLANMSHELRTPLNAVIGFSEVLSERMFGELNEKQDEYLKDIHASGQHLLSLINDILDLSKIEAGRMELELTDFDLPTGLENALTLVRERAGRRGIALGLTVDERLGQIKADERKVRQVVLNLLSNAIKFTPEGGRIEVRAVPVDSSVEVSVTDTGVGIAPEDQEAIFEEFKQVGTPDKKVEGTGLGLALSRKFVELHSGRIWVKSQPGQGSTFTFTIPRSR